MKGAVREGGGERRREGGGREGRKRKGVREKGKGWKGRERDEEGGRDGREEKGRKGEGEGLEGEGLEGEGGRETNRGREAGDTIKTSSLRPPLLTPAHPPANPFMAAAKER